MLSLPLPRLTRPVVALIGAGALVLTTWGGSSGVDTQLASSPGEDELAHAAAPDLGLETPSPTDVPPVQDASEPELTIPDVPESPTAPGEPEEESEPKADDEPLPEEVDLHKPDIVLRDAEQDLEDLDLDAADHIAEVAEFTATTESGPLREDDDDEDDGPHELEVMAVDGETFRPLTPEVTAQSPDVWERLRDGDVLVRHDTAHKLGLELGGRMILRTDHGTLPVRIGALAANGAPPLAEVIVPLDVASLLGVDELDSLLLAAEDDPEGLAEQLSDVGDVELRKEPEPEQAPAQPTGEQGTGTATSGGPVELESFTYTSRGDGTIEIHGDWASRNIVPVDIPGMGTTRCHRAMVPQLMAALREIHEAGLYGHFDPSQFGGCWVPRHIMWNPSRGLSMHAWGLAIDFNVSTNMYGAEPQLHPGIVEIFKKWGFAWGGDWSTPDGMHFEVDRFVRVE
jgi:hypothetical protein